MAGHDYYGGDVMPGGVGMGMHPGGMGLGYERMFPCVKLRGLPFTVTEDEIRMFLGGEPVDILTIKRDGRFTGEAFVVFGSPMQVEMALSKNKGYMGRRYIEVFRAKKLDYYKAILAEMTDGPVSYNITDGHRVPRRGGGGGGAYYGGGGPGGGPPPMDAQPGEFPASNVLRLRGLPFSVQREDIVNWFNDGTLSISQIRPESVFIVMDYGRPSGTAFVEFQTPEDAQVAMSKDRQMMGTRYIEIFSSSPEERARSRGDGPNGMRPYGEQQMEPEDLEGPF
eukprot:evm.model.scf_2585.2 EVM.evm.TU.scf_2585.2   scf_2585:12737-19061(-)